MKSASGVCDAWNVQLAVTRANLEAQNGDGDLPFPEPPQPTQSSGAIPCGLNHGFSRNGMNTLTLGGGEVSRLAKELREFVRTPVSDATGLTGTFDIDLSWDAAPLSADTAETRPSLANALEDQLGLKLQPTKAIVEVLVIDRIERPTPN
jgi:uncharacterized protein (TIGR03435 family)